MQQGFIQQHPPAQHVGCWPCFPFGFGSAGENEGAAAGDESAHLSVPGALSECCFDHLEPRKVPTTCVLPSALKLCLLKTGEKLYEMHALLYLLG